MAPLPVTLRINFKVTFAIWNSAENLCPSATVVRVHDGVIRGVISNTGGIVKSTLVDHSYPLVDLNKIGCTEVCWWHARHCMLAVRLLGLAQRCVYKTMQVAEWNVAVAESAPRVDTRAVFIGTTVGQYFNWYWASRGSLGDSWASSFSALAARQVVAALWTPYTGTV